MLPPNSKPVKEIHKESGILLGTLKKWKSDARKKGFSAPASGQKSELWSTRDKFLIVVETSTLNETDLAEYCRKKGLHIEQVKAWQDNCMQANGGVAKQLKLVKRSEKEKDQELKALKKELQRKESALAETAALLVLRKKADAIWGDLEGD